MATRARHPRRAALGRAPEVVAPTLLGAVVESRVGGGLVAVRLTEVEAYAGPGLDPASHAFRGRTPRNAPMFGPPGHAYVYFVYGMHVCANVVTGPEGTASAVLLRAGEVIVGADLARTRRPAARRDRDLARGPARLAAALGIDLALDSVDLLDPDSPLRLVAGAPAGEVIAGPRIGIRHGREAPWRFRLAGDAFVSDGRPPSRGQSDGPARAR